MRTIRDFFRNFFSDREPLFERHEDYQRYRRERGQAELIAAMASAGWR